MAPSSALRCSSRRLKNSSYGGPGIGDCLCYINGLFGTGALQYGLRHAVGVWVSWMSWVSLRGRVLAIVDSEKAELNSAVV
jgi:hypothetical protein